MPSSAVAATTGIALTSSRWRSGTSTSSTVAAAGMTTNRERKSIRSVPHPEVREDRHDPDERERHVAVQVAVEEEPHEPAEPLREGREAVDDALHEDVLLEEGADVGDALLHLPHEPEVDLVEVELVHDEPVDVREPRDERVDRPRAAAVETP